MNNTSDNNLPSKLDNKVSNKGIKKSLFLGLSGLPNAGKSSLLNTLLKTKIAATSYRPQTTRNSIRGIVTRNNAQIVIIDSPGFFNPKADLEKKILQTAIQTIQECDITCIVIDANKGLNNGVKALIKKCALEQKEILAVINKTDTVKKATLLPLAQMLVDEYQIKDVFFTSCKTGDGINMFYDYIFNSTKPDHWYYDPFQKTNRDINFVTEEITREKIFLYLREEVPYKANVKTDEIVKKDNIILIKQTISTLNQTYKGIIIGKKGGMLRNISIEATKDMEEILKQRVHLSISVDIEDWINKWESS